MAVSDRACHGSLSGGQYTCVSRGMRFFLFSCGMWPARAVSSGPPWGQPGTPAPACTPDAQATLPTARGITHMPYRRQATHIVLSLAALTQHTSRTVGRGRVPQAFCCRTLLRGSEGAWQGQPKRRWLEEPTCQSKKGALSAPNTTDGWRWGRRWMKVGAPLEPGTAVAWLSVAPASDVWPWPASGAMVLQAASTCNKPHTHQHSTTSTPCPPPPLGWPPPQPAARPLPSSCSPRALPHHSSVRLMKFLNLLLLL